MTLGVVSGIRFNKNNKEIKETNADAVNGVILVTANDSTCSDTKYYSQSGSDKTSLSYTNDLKSTNTGHYNFSSVEGAYSATEDSANKLYNYVYRPFFVYPQESGYIGIPKASRYTITINFKLKLTKSASGGTARAFAELFFLGNGNGKPEPVLSTGSFDTNDSQSSNTSTSYNNASNSDSSIGVYTNQPSSTITTQKQLTITFDNESTTNNNVVRYQLGLFVGCNYASGKDHTTDATVEMTISTVSKNNLLAQVGSNYYTDFQTALSAYNSTANQTFKLLQNVNVSAATEAFRNVNLSGTINLNGFTLTSNNMFALTIRNNATVTIQNGTIAHTGNQYGVYVVSGSTVTIPSNVTITSSGTACIFNAGTLTFQGTSTSSSGYALNNEGTATVSGATLTTNGDTATCVYNAGTLNIYNSTLNAKSNGKSLFIGGASAITRIYGSSSLQRSIEVKSGCKLQKLYLYNGSTRYTGSAMSLKFNDTLAHGDIVYYAYNSSDVSKISITNSLETYLGYSYNTSSKAYGVQYNLYTITVNHAHGTYTVSKSTNVTHADTVNATYTLDDGYVLNTYNGGISATNCTVTNIDYDNRTFNIINANGNATVTINAVLQAFKLEYDGNGTTSLTTNAGKEGYHSSTGSYNVHWGDTITVLNNAYRKDGYMFTGWNTAPDGTGLAYQPGDTFVIHEATTLYAQWIEVDYVALDEFVSNYMHLNDYANNFGYCISYQGGDGYYIIAKRALVGLTDNQINVFKTDMRYSTARNRYEHWAVANHDLEYAYVNDFTHISSSRGVNDIHNNTSAWLIVTVTSIITLSSVGLFLLLKRKRHLHK